MAPAEPAGAAPSIQVEVVYCAAPGQVDLSILSLPADATVAAALQASGVLQRHGLPLEGLAVGVWFKQRALDSVLRDRDRVEVYRPLTVDPKEARRLRYKRKSGKSGVPAKPGQS